MNVLKEFKNSKKGILRKELTDKASKKSITDLEQKRLDELNSEYQDLLSQIPDDDVDSLVDAEAD